MCELVKTGDECPGGIAAFHFTWLSGPNSTGRFVALDTPVPLGPRNLDQFSDADKTEGAATNANAIATHAVRKTRRPALRARRKARRHDLVLRAALVGARVRLSLLWDGHEPVQCTEVDDGSG